jgi:hypothetical protein
MKKQKNKTEIFNLFEDDGFFIGIIYFENNKVKTSMEIRYKSSTEELNITKHK